MDIPTLTTARLKLRSFRTSDFESYSEMFEDPRFTKFLSGRTLTKLEAWENMALMLGHWQLCGYGVWAIEHKQTGELLGRAGLLNLPGWPDVEICWALSPKFWGNGYATEAARACLSWAFDVASIPKLISLIQPDNERSAALAARLGGTLREQIIFQSKPTNVFEFTL